MAKTQQRLVTHTFCGKRFEDHGLDLDVLPELYAYKKILLETAKEIWKRRRPERQRLKKNFEEAVSLKFFEIEPGSAAVPIMREVEQPDQPDLLRREPEQLDELEEAVHLITEAVAASANDQPLPETLPKNIIPLFESYGKTLRDDEYFELQPQGSSKKAAYSPKSRERLMRFCAEDYTDKIDFTGEVRAVDLGGSFILRLDDGTKVPARFSPQQEVVVTEALRDHASRRLQVKGTAEYQSDGKVKGIVSVSELTVHAAGEVSFDPSARPVWQVIEEIGAAVPDLEWEKMPADGAKNLDHYLYGHAKKL